MAGKRVPPLAKAIRAELMRKATETADAIEELMMARSDGARVRRRVPPREVVAPEDRVTKARARQLLARLGIR